jgi:WD40 repeat protein
MWFKEVLHVTSHRTHRSPPPLSVVRPGALDQLWSLLTDEQRQRTLITLCGIVLPTLASAGDRMVRPWDAATDAARAILKGHEDLVRTVAFSHDGKTLASAADDRMVRLWDGATGAARASIKGHEKWVFAVAFSSDGTTLASAGDDGTVRLWDAATGEPFAILKGHECSLYALAFSPDGRTLASAGDDGTVRLW